MKLLKQFKRVAYKYEENSMTSFVKINLFFYLYTKCFNFNFYLLINLKDT